jgi:hypothetical protein
MSDCLQLHQLCVTQFAVMCLHVLLLLLLLLHVQWQYVTSTYTPLLAAHNSSPQHHHAMRLRLS